MGRIKTFLAGMAGGMAVAAATAYAAGVLHWTHGNVEAANALFGERSGLSFTVEPPPDPDSGQTLVVHAQPFAGLNQLLSVSAYPPGPCFIAHIPPPDPGIPPGPCRITVFQPDQIQFEAPDGTPLSLCSANGLPHN
jgi:hypothetical protein